MSSVLDVFGRVLERFVEVSWKCSGRVLEVFWTSPFAVVRPAPIKCPTAVARQVRPPPRKATCRAARACREDDVDDVDDRANLTRAGQGDIFGGPRRVSEWSDRALFRSRGRGRLAALGPAKAAAGSARGALREGTTLHPACMACCTTPRRLAGAWRSVASWLNWLMPQSCPPELPRQAPRVVCRSMA